jgi:undecaprenyl diphosphate synthase
MTPKTDASGELRVEELRAQLNPSRRPRHIAIIMDGNGRWARARGLSRLEGHRAGRESIRETVTVCAELGVEYLTLYTFSSENWRRPENEVRALMQLIEHALHEEIERLHAKGVRLRVLGRKESLPTSLQEAMAKAEAMTARNDGLVLQLAINYGGRQEILDAAVGLAREVAEGRLALDDIEESHLARHLYLPDTPDPDLLIRTGGDLRVSNYLLWEIAYSEICVLPVLWPDFRREDVYTALLEYQGRERRFGGLRDAP